MINFKIITEKQTDTNGSFILEPLDQGFGHTIGNTFRRVLLSSLEGTAITSVKIDGVSHQFATIPGVSEDVIQIILNLKKVRLRIFGNQQVKLTLKASGKKEVTAADIDTAGAAEVVNPEQHIATLTAPSAKLSIEMNADKGVGYVSTDEKKTSEIGLMPIDSIYTPVTFVNYKVEPTRVGRSTNFEKVVLEIVTDGTMKPEEALYKSAKMLSTYFRQAYEPVFEEEEAPKPAVNEGLMKLSVEELDLPVRITNALKAIDIDTVEKLVETSKNHLLKAKNLGVQSINLISQKLEERGLTLSEA